jgi:hypothetical protein
MFIKKKKKNKKKDSVIGMGGDYYVIVDNCQSVVVSVFFFIAIVECYPSVPPLLPLLAIWLFRLKIIIIILEENNKIESELYSPVSCTPISSILYTTHRFKIIY